MAIFATDDQQRVYPGQTLAAHVVGYVSGEGVEQTGMNGIELEYNLQTQRRPRLAAHRTGQAPARIAGLSRRGHRAARRTQCGADPGRRIAKHHGVRTGRRHAPARAHQHFLRHDPPAHRGDSGPGQLSDLQSQPSRARFPPEALAQPRDRRQPRAGFHLQNRGGERRAQREAGQLKRRFLL